MEGGREGRRRRERESEGEVESEREGGREGGRELFNRADSALRCQWTPPHPNLNCLECF